MNGLVLLPMLRFPFVFNSRFWQLRGIQEISPMVEIKKAALQTKLRLSGSILIILFFPEFFHFFQSFSFGFRNHFPDKNKRK